MGRYKSESDTGNQKPHFVLRVGTTPFPPPLQKGGSEPSTPVGEGDQSSLLLFHRSSCSEPSLIGCPCCWGQEERPDQLGEELVGVSCEQRPTETNSCFMAQVAGQTGKSGAYSHSIASGAPVGLAYFPFPGARPT